MDKEFMTIDGVEVELNGERNILEVARKAGIDIPAFCYDPELSIYGACRMCVFENERGGIDASCSAQPRAGMVIKTNTPRLRKYRKMVLELLLANHCRECTTCSKSNNCKLQEFALRYNLSGVRFPNSAKDGGADDSSLSIVRTPNKCILCGKCVRMCNEVQNVGAIDYGFRSSKMKIVTAFDGEIANSPCVGCGQCAAVCPVGAIVVKDDSERVWDALGDSNTEVSVQVAPAVRVALGKELGLKEGEPLMGKLVSALRKMGFNKVYDTSLGADMTVLEEANELLTRLKNGGKFPMFTSCCPAWIKYAEQKYPDLLNNISTCRSPMEMFASVIKSEYKGEKKHLHVAIMPCTAKKFEAAREEFITKDGSEAVDIVLTTQEIVKMIKSAGIDFASLNCGTPDSPFEEITGAGVIFGVTGGVTEAVLRYASKDKSAKALEKISYVGVRGLKGVKEATVNIAGKDLKIAVVSGLKNASALIDGIKAGKLWYDFVEVMSCPAGCINGGGQPRVEYYDRALRAEGLYKADEAEVKRASDENEEVKAILAGMDEHKKHELLHTSYKAR